MELDERLYGMHHELQSPQYAKLRKQLQLIKVKAKLLYTIAIYLKKLENSQQKKDLMLDSKNLGDQRNF